MTVIKFLGNDIYRTQVLGNAAAKIGLITEQENVLAQRAAAMQGNKIMNIKKMKAMFDKQSLFNVIQEGIQRKVNLATIYMEEKIAKVKTFLQKSLNKQLLIEGLTRIKNFAKAAAGFLLDVGKLAVNAAIAVAGIPVIGPILAVAAAAAAVAGGMALYNKFKKPAGDMIGDADGKTQVSPAEGGLFELSNNDQFVAAPGIADAVTGRNRSQRREERQQRREERREERREKNINDNTKLEQSMNKTNQILEIVANQLKPKPILGSEIGQAVNVAEYNIQ